MTKFDFTADATIRLIKRCYFTIEAESKEEAIKKIKRFKDVLTPEAIENNFDDFKSELLIQTQEFILPSEFDGLPTLDITDVDEAKIILTNES